MDPPEMVMSEALVIDAVRTPRGIGKAGRADPSPQLEEGK